MLYTQKLYNENSSWSSGTCKRNCLLSQGLMGYPLKCYHILENELNDIVAKLISSIKPISDIKIKDWESLVWYRISTPMSIVSWNGNQVSKLLISNEYINFSSGLNGQFCM